MQVGAASPSAVATNRIVSGRVICERRVRRNVPGMTFSSQRRWWARACPLGSLLAVAFCLMPGCDDHDAFRADVLMCEEAVKYLKTCCAGVQATVWALSCRYSYEANVNESSSSSSSSDSDCGGWCGCQDRETLPDLSEVQSRCLLAHSCEALTGAGACVGGHGRASDPRQVCP